MVRYLLINAGIAGIGASVPDRVLTNHDLEKMVETSDEWIQSRTGIRERRVASGDEATSDLALRAAREAMAEAGIEGSDIDLIIVATVTPDHLFPSTACILQRELGAVKAAAFDIEAACSGFIYALSVGSQFIETGTYETVLVVGAETLSKITDFTDRTTCILFGDGAGAAVLKPVGEGEGILATHLGADGTGGDLLIQPAGGSRIPATLKSVEERQHFTRMNGREVFKFAVRIMEEAALAVLDQADLSKEDVDFFVPHQANLRILEAAAKRIDLQDGQYIVNLDRYGNMSSASVPVALYEAVRGGQIQSGDTVLLVAFGGGLTWASSVLRWK